MAPKCFLLFVVFSCWIGVLCQFRQGPWPPMSPWPPLPWQSRADREASAWRMSEGLSDRCSNGDQQTCERERYIDTDACDGGKARPSLRATKYGLWPVDCLLGNWSEWSDCTTCGSGGRSRHRAVVQPAEFNGMPCGSDSALIQVDWNCNANDTCDTDSCNTDEFNCTDGYCISHYLECNGDDDCDDNSDERNCDKINGKCPTGKQIPRISKAGRGVDILSNELRHGILDNAKYNGGCFIIQSNKVDLRKPWNIQDYNEQVGSIRNRISKGYKSSKEYRNDIKNTFSFSLSGGLDALGGLSKAASLSISVETGKLVKDSASGSSSYFSLEFEIGIASFTTRTGKLLLKKPFVDYIRRLPKHYDFDKYTKLFRDYGTHYMSSGTFGGKYKHVIQYSNEQIFSLDTDALKGCVEFAMSNKSVKGLTMGGTAKFCHDKLSSKNGSALSFASDISTSVIGGSTVTRSALVLTEGRTPSRKDYDAWTQTISERPAITSFKLAPVTDLLPNHKREYGVRALVDYLKLYDPANCKVPCRNGGKLVVVSGGRECRCVCSFPYHGVGCEEELKKPIISTGVKGIPASWLISSFICISCVCVCVIYYYGAYNR